MKPRFIWFKDLDVSTPRLGLRCSLKVSRTGNSKRLNRVIRKNNGKESTTHRTYSVNESNLYLHVFCSLTLLSLYRLSLSRNHSLLDLNLFYGLRMEGKKSKLLPELL